MGHKKVCLECKKILNRPFDSGSELTYPCPECGQPMLLLPHRFRPPKKGDNKKWEVVRFLISEGFYYQHIHKIEEVKIGLDSKREFVEYPDNMRDARDFVARYKDQAIIKCRTGF